MYPTIYLAMKRKKASKKEKAKELGVRESQKDRSSGLSLYGKITKFPTYMLTLDHVMIFFYILYMSCFV